MVSTFFAAWLLLPAAPLNPVKQDTVASINFHSTIGISAPNGIISSGPEITAKYELRVHHHVILRGAAEYRYGELVSKLYPRGSIHSFTLALEGLYYQGTNDVMGFIGGGPVYNFNDYDPWPATSTTLIKQQVTNITLDKALGYRFLIGFRWKRHYALELTVTELYPILAQETRINQSQFSRESRSLKIGSFRISLGYLLPIRP